MKRLLGIGLLTVGLVLLGTGSAKATVVTTVTDLINADHEKVTVNATASDEVIGGYWKYIYEVTNVSFDDMMYGFQVANDYNYTIENVTSPDGWTFDSILGTDPRFIWTTSLSGGSPLNIGDSPLTFEMKTPISEGSYPSLQYAEAQDKKDCIGKTLSPVPEPASLLLLGSGLLGFGLLGKARRKRS